MRAAATARVVLRLFARSCVLLVGLASHCTSNYVGLARETFVKQFSCPPEQVRVDMHRGPPWPSPEAPPEVAADPDRLVVWQREQRAKREEQAGKTYYLLSGCGHHVTYDCGGWDFDVCSDAAPFPPLSPPAWRTGTGVPEAGSP